MKYIQSNNFDKIRLLEVLKLDDIVYDKSFTGTFESVSERYKKNTEMFIFAVDKEDNLCGYICFFPLSPRLINELEVGEVMFDDNIAADDVLNYSKEVLNNVFVISVAVNPKYKGSGLGTSLMQEMFSTFRSLEKRGYSIGKVYATTTSKEGEKLFSKFNFKNIRVYRNGAKLVKYNFAW